MFGWSISARACRSASNRASTCRRVHPRLDHLQGDLPPDRLGLLGQADRRPCRPRRSAPAACTGRSTVPGPLGRGRVESAVASRRPGGRRVPGSCRPGRGRRAAPRPAAAGPASPPQARSRNAARSAGSAISRASAEDRSRRRSDGAVMGGLRGRRLYRHSADSGGGRGSRNRGNCRRPGQSPAQPAVQPGPGVGPVPRRRWPGRCRGRRPPPRRSGRRSTGA